VALGYGVERWIRLGRARLGSGGAAEDVVAAVRAGGAERGLAAARAHDLPATRVLAVAIEHAGCAFLERQKAVEDAAARELRALAANLRPLYLVYLVAPLLGLLGTVWGMIEAFSDIATAQGLGKPELLAGGIYQALVTTAAGLAVAIPALVLHHHLKGKLEGFARALEQREHELEQALAGRRAAHARAEPAERAGLALDGGEVGVARP
jgi:biopolymer transport protein ExbB